MLAISLIVGTGNDLSEGLNVIPKMEGEIGAAHAVGIRYTSIALAQGPVCGDRAHLTVTVEHTHLRLLPQITRQAAHGEVGALAAQRIAIGNAAAGPSVINGEHADSIRPQLAREL